MDSTNLPETQSAPLNCRNTASNTSPIACACCGSKDYVQTIPHVNYFRTLGHGISRCKHSQDNCEEKCLVPPFLSPVPLLQPFLHNFSFPGNAYCSHNHLDDADTGLNQLSEHNKADNEKKVPHSEDLYAFDQKEKPDFKDDKTSFYENPQKNFAALGPEYPFSAHPFFLSNSKDIHFNPYIQRCACGDSTPWTCSPFIIPIVSYYLFWNSQKCNNILPANYPSNQPEMMFPQCSEAPSNLKHSSSDTSEGKMKKNFDINNQQVNNSSDNLNDASEDFLEDDKVAKKGQIIHAKNNGNSSFPMAASSESFTEDNGSNNTNRSDDSGCSNGVRMGEAMEVDGIVANDQMGSDEFLKMDENTTSSSKVQLLISLDSNDDYLKSNEDLTQQPLPSEVPEELENSVEHLSVSEASEKALLSLKRSYKKVEDSDEERGKISPEYKATIFKERMSFKKFIKNFTITDQTTGGVSEEVHIYAAAAGDLGGENCIGYKVLIPPSEGDQQEKIRQETQTEVNLEAKEALLLKGLAELKEKQPENFLEKNAETGNSRFRSGIAKPSSSTKSREIKELNGKKDNKDFSQDESYVVKRKHSCFPSDAMGHLENSSKILKMKNCSAIHHQKQGSGKLQRTLYNKTQLFKKEEVPTLKSRPQIIQKQSNIAAMKSRKN